MSQENVELAFRAYGAVNRRDFDAFLGTDGRGRGGRLAHRRTQ
ncbi:MAG TPA: hypothetical protein VK304_07290 [Thermoleophilaceae bacterium]|nr:hypothetical protein [Thermoleophilaceae bacterium]